MELFLINMFLMCRYLLAVPDDVVVVLIIIAVIVDLLRRLLRGHRQIVGRLQFRLLLDVAVVIAGLRARLLVGAQVLLELSSLFGIVDLSDERRISCCCLLINGIH